MLLQLFSLFRDLKANPATVVLSVVGEDLSVTIAIIKGSERNFRKIYMYIHMCMHICMHTCMDACICTYKHKYKHT